jgi:hypothetical protein
MVCGGTVLQAGRSRVWFPMGSLEFFINLILQAALEPWVRLSAREYILEGGGGWVGKDSQYLGLTNYLTTFICRLSGDLGASHSWNAQGLLRPVQWLLYLSALCLQNCLEENELNVSSYRESVHKLLRKLIVIIIVIICGNKILYIWKKRCIIYARNVSFFRITEILTLQSFRNCFV